MISSEHTHPWRDPCVFIADPLGGNQQPITPWLSLKFHPIGLLHLRRHLGVYPHIPGFFQKLQASFDASNIAWFAAGKHKDRRHTIGPNDLHPEYLDLHNVCSAEKEKCVHQKKMLQKILDLIFDLATLLDHAGGGTTLVLHAKATAVPGSPYQPEYFKADTYFPRAFLDEHPTIRPVLFQIAQDFITHIGVPTAQDWNQRIRASLGWGFVTTYSAPAPNKPMLDVPNPENGTCHYVFRGQPVPLDPPAPSLVPLSGSQQSQASTEYNFEDFDGEFLASLTYQEFQLQIATLGSEAKALRQEWQDLICQVSMLERMLQMSDSHPAIPPVTPNNRSLVKSSQKSVPHTPTRAPSNSRVDSPFVMIQSDRHRSPFVASPSRVPVRPTTPGPSTPRCTAHFARDVSPDHNPFSVDADDSLTPVNTILDHILAAHNLSNLKPQMLLINRFFNKDQIPSELSRASVPDEALNLVLKALLFDSFGQ